MRASRMVQAPIASASVPTLHVVVGCSWPFSTSSRTDEGPWHNMDAELPISFKGRFQSSLRLSDSVLALPTFAALLAQVLHCLEHGPSSVLTSVVDTFFSYVPHSDRGTPNQVLRILSDDLQSRIALKEQLDLTPILLPLALVTSFLPQAPGAAGVLVSG
jgi:hypothetical protein